MTFFTSHDPATSDTLVKAGTLALRYLDFDEALQRHRSAWQDVWTACASMFLVTSGSGLVRLHIDHVLRVCSRHTADLGAGVPARAQRRAYRGVFWDELYVYPFLSFRMPEVARRC